MVIPCTVCLFRSNSYTPWLLNWEIVLCSLRSPVGPFSSSSKGQNMLQLPYKRVENTKYYLNKIKDEEEEDTRVTGQLCLLFGHL